MICSRHINYSVNQKKSHSCSIAEVQLATLSGLGKASPTAVRATNTFRHDGRTAERKRRAWECVRNTNEAWSVYKDRIRRWLLHLWQSLPRWQPIPPRLTDLFKHKNPRRSNKCLVTVWSHQCHFQPWLNTCHASPMYFKTCPWWWGGWNQTLELIW